MIHTKTLASKNIFYPCPFSFAISVPCAKEYATDTNPRRLAVDWLSPAWMAISKVRWKYNRRREKVAKRTLTFVIRSIFRDEVGCIYVPHLYPFICHWTFRLLCNGILIAIKRNDIGSFVEIWMPLPRICQRVWSKSGEKQMLFINAYMWNLEEKCRWTCLQGRNRDQM